MTTNKLINHNRSLIILGFSETVSGMGNWITAMAVFAIVLFQKEGTLSQSSAIYLASLLPTLLFSQAAGWICDRFNRKWVMITSELLAGTVVIGLIFTENFSWILGILVLQAIFSSLITPARQSTVPLLVTKEELTRANALLQQLASIVKITAPMLAGALLAVFDPHKIILLDILSYLVSAFLLLFLPDLKPSSEDKEIIQNSIKETRGGSVLKKTFKESPGLLLIFITAFMTTLSIIGFDVISPVYFRDSLKSNESFMGLAIGIIGLGTFAASLFLMLSKKQRSPWKDIRSSIFLLAFLPGAIYFTTLLGPGWPAYMLISLGALLAGISSGLMGIQSSTLLQKLTPINILGQISGLFQSVLISGQFIGVLLVPLIVPAWFNIAGYSLLITSALLLTAFSTLVLFKRITRPEQEEYPLKLIEKPLDKVIP